jgi:hypothetical protein
MSLASVTAEARSRNEETVHRRAVLVTRFNNYVGLGEV